MKGETQMIQKLTDMPHGTIHPSSRGQNIGKRNVHTQEILCNYRLFSKSKVIFVIHDNAYDAEENFTYNLKLKISILPIVFWCTVANIKTENHKLRTS